MSYLQFKLLKDTPHAKAGMIVERLHGFKTSFCYRCENGENFWIPTASEKDFLELVETTDPDLGDKYRAAYENHAKECALIAELLKKHCANSSI